MIVTVTFNPAVDHTIRVADELTPDEVLRTESSQFDAGGKGINVSTYLDALGTRTLATGPVGGLSGEYVERRLAEAGVPHDFVAFDGHTRLNTTLLTDDGEYKLNQPGCRVSPHTVDELIATIRHYGPDVVVVAGSLPPGLDAGSVDRLGSAGDWETVVDLSGDVLPALNTSHRLCTPNRRELAAATGRPTGTTDECHRAAETLRERGFDSVVVTMGAEGALLVNDDVRHVPAADVPVVDTAGAGDALLAGLLAAEADGASLDTALRYGVHVAEQAVGVHGTSVPDVAGLDSLRSP